MERGQEGRPAHGTDEAVEAIESAGAQVDGDAHEVIEDGASTEGPSPRHVPGAGPPAHWLAYIRARAPWLLSAGGLIGKTTEGSSPDVVPHGPAAHVAPWPPVEPGVSAAGAATTQAPAFGDAPGMRAAGHREEALTSDTAAEQRRRDGGQAFSGVPEIAAERHASEDRPRSNDDPGGRRGDVEAPLRDEPPEAATSLEPAGRDVTGEEPAHARPPATWTEEPGDDTGQAAAVAPLALIPSPDPSSPPAPSIAWPTFTRSDDRTTRPHPGQPWPPPVARAPRTVSPMSEPSPITEHANAAFDPLPARIRPDATPFDFGGWRVRAAAPDTSMVARLALPPWPDLPEPPPDDDDPDWRAIERRLQRAARLDREQRRR